MLQSGQVKRQYLMKVPVTIETKLQPTFNRTYLRQDDDIVGAKRDLKRSLLAGAIVFGIMLAVAFAAVLTA